MDNIYNEILYNCSYKIYNAKKFFKRYVNPNLVSFYTYKKDLNIKKLHIIKEIDNDSKIIIKKNGIFLNDDKICNDILNNLYIDYLKYDLAYTFIKLSNNDDKNETNAYIYAINYIYLTKINSNSITVDTPNGKKILSLESILSFIVKYNHKMHKQSNIKNLKIYNQSFIQNKNKTLTKELLGKYLVMTNSVENNKKLMPLLKRKVDFYNSINFNTLNIGTYTFDGYIGFEYKNYIILEKFWENTSTLKIAQNEAIYLIKKEDLNNIMNKTKQEVMNDIKIGKITAKRIYHNKNWEYILKKELKIN